MQFIITDKPNRVIPFLIARLISFPRHHLSTNPTFTLTYFYVWTQTALYISLITSITPCLKPFVAGLNTGYGAFDTERVGSRAYGTYGLHGYAPKSSRTKRSSNLLSKSMSSSAKEPNNLPIGGIRNEQAITDNTVVSLNTAHHGRQSPSAASRLAGQGEEPGEGKATKHTEAVAQDGNSIGSNDSRQMIIRKDVTWAVEYSAP